MRNARIVILLSTLLLVGGTLSPLPARAQSAFLPNCEKTVYLVQNRIGPPGNIPGIQIQSGPYKGEWGVYPDQYDINRHGEITGLTTNAQCGFNDFLRLFLNVVNWGMGVLASLAVLLFIWGGFNLLISGGRAQKVEEGKKILTGTIIGILVIFTAWMFVHFWVVVTSGDSAGTIFASYPDIARPWSGAKSCRFSPDFKPGCDRNDLHRGCGDGKNGQAGRITQAQQLLAQLRCNPGPADGCFGRQTEEAVNTFQQVRGIPDDEPGHIQENTWLELENPSEACDGLEP